MPYVNGHYYSDSEIRAIRSKSSDEQFENFLISGVIAGLTGSALLGWAIGGDLLGGILGDLFF
jgi:hypothetical protein